MLRRGVEGKDGIPPWLALRPPNTGRVILAVDNGKLVIRNA
jgi:hypothetical protein